MLRANYTQRAATGANILCGLVAFTGVLVMLGWFFDISALKSIYPGWVTMKFATAFSFLLSGATIYCVGRIARGDRAWAQLLLPGLVLMLLLPMAALIATMVLNVNVGVAEMFVQEAGRAVQTVQPGRPSAMTMVCFILVAAVGLTAMFVPTGKPRLWRIMGTALGVLGGVALLGYVLDSPVLYYYWEGFSTAMAVHTALLFVLLGASLWLTAVSIDNGQGTPQP